MHLALVGSIKQIPFVFFSGAIGGLFCCRSNMCGGEQTAAAFLQREIVADVM